MDYQQRFEKEEELRNIMLKIIPHDPIEIEYFLSNAISKLNDEELTQELNDWLDKV
jgi:DNA-directed RNA polymerase subunit F